MLCWANLCAAVWRRMDIEEYKKKNPPKGKRSILHQYRSQIFALREGGYTYAQIAEYLSLNGVKATGVWVGKFINAELDKGGKSLAASGHKKETVRFEGRETEDEEMHDPSKYQAHDPRSITEILESPVDLDAYAKLAPKTKRTKKWK